MISNFGKLYVVGTPIGNLEDITLRALRVLKEVDLILCEDTRVTRKLLDHYKIDTPTESYHTHSKLKKVEKILGMLGEGKSLALVSDSGTPTISDPGVKLVSKIKEKFPSFAKASAGKGADVSIIPIPGPCALVTALSASGIPASEFLFLGFLPHKKGRETLFKEIAKSKRTVVFYESPHRILKTLGSLKEHLEPNRKIVIARELTKIFEEIISGTPEELLNYFEENPEKIKGEFVVIIGKKWDFIEK